jgi:FMN reductase
MPEMKMGVAKPVILGIGGTTCPASVTERALTVSLQAAVEEGSATLLIAGPDLILPMYSPIEAERAAAAIQLVDALRACDGLIIASPSYHGSVSGLIKNALDYVEDLRADRRVYLDGVAVGLIACAGGWQGASQTLAALRAIVHALRGWPTPLGAALNTSTRLFDEAGHCVDLSSKFQLETVGRQVVEFCRMRSGLGRKDTEATVLP